MKPIALSSLLLMLACSISNAHRLDLAYYIEEDHLVIEAWMGGNDPVVEGEVTLMDDTGNILASGVTDENGRYRWPIELIQNLTVQVYAERGHQKAIELSADELKELAKQVSASSLPVNQEVESGTDVVSNKTHESQNTQPTRSHVRSTQDQFGMPERTILGLTFILAASAAWMSYRNNQKLSAIEDAIHKMRDKN